MDSQLFLLLVGKHVRIDRFNLSDDVLQETTVGTIASVLFDGFPSSNGQTTIYMHDDQVVTYTPDNDYVKVRVFE